MAGILQHRTVWRGTRGLAVGDGLLHVGQYPQGQEYAALSTERLCAEIRSQAATDRRRNESNLEIYLGN